MKARNPNIFIFDDSVSELEYIESILSKNSFQPIPVKDRSTFFKLLERFEADLILLDIIMPDINGFEVCKQLKQDERYAEIPVVFLTSLTKDSDIIKGLESGAVDFITKPFNEQILLLRINSVLNQYEQINKYNTMFRNMLSGACLIEVQLFNNRNVVDTKVLDVNSVFEKQVGINKELIIGKNPVDVFPNLGFNWFEKLDEIFLTGESFYLDYYSEENYNWYSIKAYFVSRTAFVVLIDNVTERKRAEFAIQKQNTKLKQLNATKDKFFSIISHDLKNPLFSMEGLFELLIHNFDRYNSEKKKEFIQLISSELQQTIKLLENLLMWSSTQRNTLDFKPGNLKLKKVCDECIELFEQTAKTKNIKLKNNIHNGTEVFGDKNMLLTILRNLITNAIKFTNGGGQVLVKSEIKNYNNNEKQVEISVVDTGVGISSDVLSQLFLLDKNLSTPGTKKELGTGLGLVLCKELVEKQGGNIWVESAVGEGSSFIFTLPIGN